MKFYIFAAVVAFAAWMVTLPQPSNQEFGEKIMSAKLIDER